MFYDYLIDNWLQFHTAVAMVLLFVTFASVGMYIRNDVKRGCHGYVPFPKWSYRLGFTMAITIFLYLIGGPEKDWYTRHYGDPTKNLTVAQLDALENQRQYSESLFFSCLDKGQKQPHSTVFNDTNEVVKTCYDIAKLKF